MANKARSKNQNNQDLLGEDQAHLLNLPKYLGDPDADDGNQDLLGADDDGDDLEHDEEFANLQQQFEDLQGRFADNQDLTQQLLMQLATNGQNNNNQQQSNAAEEINFDDLPDPVEKRAEFNKELGTRINKILEQRTTNSDTANQYQNALNNLETSFRTNYEDLAAKPALFQSVLTQKVNQLRARGLDPKAVVFSQPDKFLKGVAEQMYDELGIDPEDDADDDDGQQQHRGKKKVQFKKRGANRTKGLGRQSTDTNARGGKSGKDKQPLGFTDQLKKTQLENGLI